MRALLCWGMGLIFLFLLLSCNGNGLPPTAGLPIHPSGAKYLGSETCKNCHNEIFNDLLTTKHPHALETLQIIGQGENPECLKCHTVGFGYESGFVNASSTPHLAGVQCESCHGPGELHVKGNGDKSKIVTYPAILSAQICGSCHTGSHQPTKEEWEASPHSEVVEHVAGYFADPNRGLTFLPSCGPCHSGDYRVWGMENGRISDVDLRGKTREEMTPVTCSLCHDPHIATGNNAEAGRETQLRHKEYWNPEEDPYMGGDPTDREVYTRVNHVCGQCHNRRGANPSDAGLEASTSRPAHYSVQLDFLLGLGGVEDGGPPALSEHRFNPKQCATCHVSMKEYESEANPAVTGHTFRVRLEGCAPCHSVGDAAARMLATKSDIEARLASLKWRLDNWGRTANIEDKAEMSWEYSAYGGPSSTGQKQIPIEVKRARYNYYYVEHDGSFGVHNAKYARYLIQVANQQLDALGVP